MFVTLDTVDGPKDIELTPLGGITATQLLSRLLKKFGKPVGKFLQDNQGIEISKLNIESIPFDILDDVEVGSVIKILSTKAFLNKVQIDPDALFAGCPDSLIKLTFHALKLNFGDAFKRLVP